MRPTAPRYLLGLTVMALAGFGYTARLVANRRTEPYDEQARAELQSVRAPAADAAAKASGPLGKEFLHFPAAVGLALALRQHELGMRAGIPVAASALAELVNRLVTETIHIRVVPPGHPAHHTGKPSFPSGHAMETTAVALSSAYVLARERMVAPAPAFLFASALAAASTVGRLVLDRHWVSDAVGGALLGVAVASASAAAYEALPA